MLAQLRHACADHSEWLRSMALGVSRVDAREAITAYYFSLLPGSPPARADRAWRRDGSLLPPGRPTGVAAGLRAWARSRD